MRVFYPPLRGYINSIRFLRHNERYFMHNFFDFCIHLKLKNSISLYRAGIILFTT